MQMPAAVIRCPTQGNSQMLRPSGRRLTASDSLALGGLDGGGLLPTATVVVRVAERRVLDPLSFPSISISTPIPIPISSPSPSLSPLSIHMLLLRTRAIAYKQLKTGPLPTPNSHRHTRHVQIKNQSTSVSVVTGLQSTPPSSRRPHLSHSFGVRPLPRPRHRRHQCPLHFVVLPSLLHSRSNLISTSD